MGIIFLLLNLAFSDTQKYWAEYCVQQLAERKLITGYPDGSFRPNSTVTRAEATVLLFTAFGDAPIKRSPNTYNRCCRWGEKF